MIFSHELAILLIDNNLAEAELLQQKLRQIPSAHCEIHHAQTLATGLTQISQRHFDLILLSDTLPSHNISTQNNNTLTITPLVSANLVSILELHPHSLIVMLMTSDDVGAALHLLDQGAHDYVVKAQLLQTPALLLKRSLLFALQQKQQAIALQLAEQQLQQERDKRLLLQQQLQDCNQELEQFVYIASHDLKQPIASIYSWSQLLQVRFGDRLDEKGHNYLGSIQTSIKQMNQLLEDLLSYSRVERATRDFVRVNCNLIAHQVLHRFRPAIAATQAQITIDELPEVYGNPVQLNQLLHHIIENALKFHEDTAIPHIQLSAEHHGTHWLFRCTDNGLGIEPDYQEQIFTAFKRLHSQAQYPGSGLGLAVCKKIIQRHGGQIWVESNPGEGSTFLFSLPNPPELSYIKDQQQ